MLKIKQLNINKEAVKAQQETAKATAAAGSGGGSSAPDPTPEAQRHQCHQVVVTMMCQASLVS